MKKESELSKGYSQYLDRRSLLAGGTAASLASLLAGCQAAESPTLSQTMALPGVEELIPDNMPVAFSSDEMKRRWARLRQSMEQGGFDVLIVPARPAGNADVKYLTESGAEWVVFPMEGKVTPIFRRDDAAAAARARADLDLDARSSLLNRSQLIIDRLQELGLDRGRIGVGNLSGTLRNDEGGVSYTTLDRIRQALPQATFESAADLLMRVKLSRGPEEIEVLRWVSRVSEIGLKAIVETARPGVVHWQVWLEAFQALVGASGEPPGRVAFRGGDEGGTSDGLPLNEKLQAGQILNENLSGAVLGYLSQVNHSFCIGSPAPRDWSSAFSYCVDLFHSLVDWIQPGRSFAEFCLFYREKVEERGEYSGGVVFHTAGPDGDGPRMGPGRDDENQDLVLEPGMVFTIKPRVPIRNISAPAAQVGDPVLVTERGAERLGRRQLELITLGA